LVYQELSEKWSKVIPMIDMFYSTVYYYILKGESNPITGMDRP